jgi:hypothetical protein
MIQIVRKSYVLLLMRKHRWLSAPAALKAKNEERKAKKAPALPEPFANSRKRPALI